MQRNAAYWLAPHGWLTSFLIASRTTCPGMVLPVVGWALSYQLLIKKMPHKHASRQVWVMVSLNWDPFFLGEPSLLSCHKLTSTVPKHSLIWLVVSLDNPGHQYSNIIRCWNFSIWVVNENLECERSEELQIQILVFWAILNYFFLCWARVHSEIL